MAAKIKTAGDTAANWTAVNPVLADGEPGVEFAAGQNTAPRMKVGDGTTPWTALPYINAPLVPPGRSALVAWCGDSITGLNGNNSTSSGDNWNGYMPVLSQGGIADGGDIRFAQAGYTLELWERDYLPQLLALTGPRKPGHAVILLGTNNVGSVTPGWNFTTASATLTRICNALDLAQIKPVLCTIPPRADSTTVNGYVQTWNAFIARLALARGYVYLDVHGATVDPATGLYLAGYSSDGIHPTAAGMKAMALACWQTLSAALPAWKPLLSDNILDGTNLIQNPLLLTNGGKYNSINGNANVAANWIVPGNTRTVSLLSDAAALGNWQRVVFPPGDAGALIQYTGTSIPTPGHRYSFAMRYRLTGVEVDPTTITLSMSFVDAGNATLSNAAPVGGWTKDPLNGAAGVLYKELVCPANAVNTRVNVQAGASASGCTVDFAQPTVRDLTALGL